MMNSTVVGDVDEHAKRERVLDVAEQMDRIQQLEEALYRSLHAEDPSLELMAAGGGNRHPFLFSGWAAHGSSETQNDKNHNESSHVVDADGTTASNGRAMASSFSQGGGEQQQQRQKSMVPGGHGRRRTTAQRKAAAEKPTEPLLLDGVHFSSLDCLHKVAEKWPSVSHRPSFYSTHFRQSVRQLMRDEGSTPHLVTDREVDSSALQPSRR